MVGSNVRWQRERYKRTRTRTAVQLSVNRIVVRSVHNDRRLVEASLDGTIWVSANVVVIHLL